MNIKQAQVKDEEEKSKKRIGNITQGAQTGSRIGMSLGALGGGIQGGVAGSAIGYGGARHAGYGKAARTLLTILGGAGGMGAGAGIGALSGAIPGAMLGGAVGASKSACDEALKKNIGAAKNWTERKFKAGVNTAKKGIEEVKKANDAYTRGYNETMNKVAGGIGSKLMSMLGTAKQGITTGAQAVGNKVKSIADAGSKSYMDSAVRHPILTGAATGGAVGAAVGLPIQMAQNKVNKNAPVKTANISDAYTKGFMDKCADRNIDPEELIKSGVIGSLIRTGKEMGQTSNQIAEGRQQSMNQYGNKGFMGRMGQRLWDPAQASRNVKGYGIGVGQQPKPVQQVPQRGPQVPTNIQRV